MKKWHIEKFEMFRSCVLSLQKRGKDLKIFAQYSSKSLSSEEIRQRIIANGRPHPEFSTIGKRINDFSGFTNIPPKNQYDKMYCFTVFGWILQNNFNMDREVALDFISNITKKISDNDNSLAQHLTTECFNRVTGYQQSKNFQDRVNRFKLRIEPKDVLLFWQDDQMSNEKSIRLVMLTYPNLATIKSSRMTKEFVPELMQKVEENFTNDGGKNYRRRYELQREKEKVKENVYTLEQMTLIYLQTNDILVWNFDFLIPDNQVLETGTLKMQNIAVLKLENCLHKKEHAEWKQCLNISTNTILPFDMVHCIDSSAIAKSSTSPKSSELCVSPRGLRIRQNFIIKVGKLFKMIKLI